MKYDTGVSAKIFMQLSYCVSRKGGKICWYWRRLWKFNLKFV